MQLLSRDEFNISIGVITWISLGHRCFCIALCIDLGVLPLPTWWLQLKSNLESIVFTSARKKIGAQRERERGGEENSVEYCRNAEMQYNDDNYNNLLPCFFPAMGSKKRYFMFSKWLLRRYKLAYLSACLQLSRCCLNEFSL